MRRRSRSIPRFEPLERRALMASISGLQFNDLNGNGALDGGEPGLAGWTVYLDLDHDHVLDGGEPSTLSGPTGAFTLNNVPAGNYSLTQIVPAGWEQTYPTAAAAPAAAMLTDSAPPSGNPMNTLALITGMS